MTTTRLTEQRISEDLPSGWSYEDHRLRRRFELADFGAAMAFMVQVAFVCEQLNHHPNWSNAYATVDVDLWTHDADGVTELDMQLAARINALFGDA